MELTKIHLIAAYSIVFVLVMAFTLVSAEDYIVEDEDPLIGRERPSRPSKRVFCNSFSGCFGEDKRTDQKPKPKSRLNWPIRKQGMMRNQFLNGRHIHQEMLQYDR